MMFHCFLALISYAPYGYKRVKNKKCICFKFTIISRLSSPRSRSKAKKEMNCFFSLLQQINGKWRQIVYFVIISYLNIDFGVVCLTICFWSYILWFSPFSSNTTNSIIDGLPVSSVYNCTCQQKLVMLICYRRQSVFAAINTWSSSYLMWRRNGTKKISVATIRSFRYFEHLSYEMMMPSEPRWLFIPRIWWFFIWVTNHTTNHCYSFDDKR